MLLQQEKLGEKIELIFKIPEELETYKIHKIFASAFCGKCDQVQFPWM